ncbi:hypothetical protein AFM12_10875 [Jiulongibacter sediminis]|uniref:Uncharacterized protein n=1 Tax=Jiulongibacter sediminis TaxID=1605367 RepID=A0A0P7BZS7_9BACT|nr:hypothetical protein AFM12_10875 [Jiulongibacter sediminis]TBX23949.1 hypothetical protein TK44_10880 [Jiulongibacter sediminis]
MTQIYICYQFTFILIEIAVSFQKSLYILIGIGLLLTNCKSEGDILHTELKSSEVSFDNKTIQFKYSYFPTSLQNIYFTKRSIEFDTIKIENFYYLASRDSITYIGKEIDDTICFLPYLKREIGSRTKFDFNTIIPDRDFIFLDAFGEFEFLRKDSLKIDHYVGKDFGRFFSDPIKISVKNGFIITSIEDTSQNGIKWSTSKSYLEKGEIIPVAKVAFLE